MCGVVGYFGKNEAVDRVIKGLERLEYRGYDSSGIAYKKENGDIELRKLAQRVRNLKEAVNGEKADIAIGHTRWATHGEPSERNAHPHFDEKKEHFLVHNGIIENYLALKEGMKDKKFTSDTDTEVVVQNLADNYDKDLLDAARKTVKELEGSYALVLISVKEKSMVFTKKGCPLIVAKKGAEYMVASDVLALGDFSNEVIYLQDGDLAKIDENGLYIENENKEVKRDKVKIDLDYSEVTKEGYEHYMLKEINEEPQRMRELIERHLKDNKIVFDEIENLDIKSFEKIYISGCGTAYYAGLIGKNIIERFMERPVICEVASELRYNYNFIDEKTLVILVSQSGETADIIKINEDALKKGARTLAVTNVVGSTLDREASCSIYTYAGAEISVASTKAFVTQACIFYLLGIYFREKSGIFNCEFYGDIVKELITLADKFEEAYEESDKEAERIAEKIKDKKAVFFIGRDLDYIIALESALKLKEISYINSWALQSGELKHGSIALIEKGTPVIGFANEKNVYDKTFSALSEVAARGAYAVLVGSQEPKEKDIDFVKIKESYTIFQPLIAILFSQLLAYKVSCKLGRDIDMPRNLAKSVTVE